MKLSEKRTQIYFPKELYGRIKVKAKKKEVSVSTVIREAVETYLNNQTKQINWENDSLFDLVGITAGKLNDGSINHDYYLYGLKKNNK